MFPRPTTVHDQVFVEATSRLAGAAAIVTWHEGAPGGLLVRAVSLLSTRPPRVLFGVAKDHPAHDGLLGARSLRAEPAVGRRRGRSRAVRRRRLDPRRFPADRWRIEADQPPRLLAGASIWQAPSITGWTPAAIPCSSCASTPPR